MFSQRNMAELSKNGCGERDAGLSQGPWQKLQPQSWVWAEREMTWLPGAMPGAAGGPGPPGMVDPVIHARQAGRSGVSRCSSEEPEQAPPGHGPGCLRGSLPASCFCGQHSGPRKALLLWICFLYCSASEVFCVSDASQRDFVLLHGIP